MQPNVLIFVPVFNCERQITRVLKALQSVPDTVASQILVVDNVSADKTVAAVHQAISEREKGPPILLKENPTNLGLGGSHKVAFHYAAAHGFDFCVTFHGDDQADVGDLIRVLESGEFQKYDHFLGSRFHKESVRERYSYLRIAGNLALNCLASLVTRFSISDLGSGLNVRRVSAVIHPRVDRLPNDLTFDVLLLLYALRKKQRVQFFPITWRHTDQKSNARVFRQGIQLLVHLARYRLQPASFV